MHQPHHRPHRPLPPTARERGGFSFIEMLVVILLLGILASLGIGAYSAIHRDFVEKVTNQRNAQEIVSMGVCATMGGAPFVISADKAATVQNLVDGTSGTTGEWKGKIFRLTMAPKAVAGALTYVKFDADLLLYEPAGGQEGP